MPRMSNEDAAAFLAAGKRTAKIAIVRRDGRPMVVPIWYAVDDDGSLIFMCWHESIKARAIRRDPRVSICIDDEEPPYTYVRLDGTAEFLDGEDVQRTWVTRLCEKYVGPELADYYVALNAIPGELIVRVSPTAVSGKSELLTPAP